MPRTVAKQVKAKAGLHVCPSCGSQLVQPTCWEQAGGHGQWRLWRRCPECEWQADAIYGEQEIDAFDEQLDEGTRELSDELKELVHENMERLGETFAAALAADLIGADDFALHG
jgi:hypothetical protein